jgi:hypothetical protein
MKPTAGARVRCAIYTRKSSEEGLEQSFNSLQAQREACEAYIACQRQRRLAQNEVVDFHVLVLSPSDLGVGCRFR